MYYCYKYYNYWLILRDINCNYTENNSILQSLPIIEGFTNRNQKTTCRGPLGPRHVFWLRLNPQL